MISLLPPNATAFERALEAGMAPIREVEPPIEHLWNPATIDADWLPWLAWGLSVDTWDAEWTEDVKRDTVAQSIALHRKKGTRHSVEMVLTRFDQLLALVEWHETVPRRAPHTFEVTLPMVTGNGVAAGGRRASAAFAEAIIREIGRVKPLREHLTFVQSVAARAAIGIQGAARVATFQRHDMALTPDTSPAWAPLLQTEDGEPIEAGDGSFLDTTP